MRRIRELLLPWISNTCYILVCVCVRTRVVLRFFRACVSVGTRASESVHARVALLIGHTEHMRNTETSFVASLAPPYFSTLSR